MPNGVSYNSYIILDEKIAVMDGVDERAEKAWFQNLEKALDGKTPDYLVVSHLEPDHAGNMQKFMEKYPQAQLVVNAKALSMLPQFFTLDMSARSVVVKEGDELNLGSHVLTFVMAPMVHWPEVMVSYEKTDKVLFSADAFGKFGALDTEEDWSCEARRYYFNIVGKYGMIAYASIHGNTGKAAEKLAELLREKGAGKVVVSDLAREDMAEVIEDAFRYDRMVLAAATYDAGIFPCMDSFLSRLKSKNYQKRTVGLIENGSWAPMAGKVMKESLSQLKEVTLLEPVVTIKSTLNESSMEQLEQLAQALVK